MNFFERYSATCIEHGIEPCSQKAATLFGISRSTISSWNTKNTFPKGETVAAIADALGVSADFLLGRTDDPIDYANGDLIAEQDPAVLDHFNGDVKKAVEFQKAVAEDVAREKAGIVPDFVSKYRMLDDVDRAKADAYLDGLLSADKYHTELQAKNA